MIGPVPTTVEVPPKTDDVGTGPSVLVGTVANTLVPGLSGRVAVGSGAATVVVGPATVVVGGPGGYWADAPAAKRRGATLHSKATTVERRDMVRIMAGASAFPPAIFMARKERVSS